MEEKISPFNQLLMSTCDKNGLSSFHEERKAVHVSADRLIHFLHFEIT